MPEYMTNLSISIIVAFVSAFFAVCLAFWRFRKETMWLRKVDEYTAILEALHVAKDEVSGEMAEFAGHSNPTDEQKEEAYRKGREAHRRIQKALDMGGFLLCPEGNAVLIDLLKGIDSAKNLPDPYGQADNISFSIQKCLKSLSSIAKEDLRLTGRWRSYRKRKMPNE